MKKIIILIFSVGFFLAESCIAKDLSKIRINPLPQTIALTFDDGPNPRSTVEILDILKKNHIHATFFVMGWAAKKYPELIRRMVSEGHAVASHTNSHSMLTKLSAQKLAFEVVMPMQVIENIIGKPPVCLRPPYGVGNKHIGNFIASKGMVMVPMGFNSFDYENRGADVLSRWVVKNARSGMVVLLHDGATYREQTVKALPAIIAGVRAKNLGFSGICYPQ